MGYLRPRPHKTKQATSGFFCFMVDFYYIKKTLGRHLKKYKASFVFFSVPIMVERRRFKLLTSAMRMQRSIS